MVTLKTILTSTPGTPPTYSVGMAETFSWVPVEGAGRPLFARAGYITNLSDLSISLSTGSINVPGVSSVTVLNPVTAVTVMNPTTAVTVTQTVPLSVSFASGTQFDSFNRLRVSNPVTLFDSSHRYQDNNLWATLTATGGFATFNSNQGLVDMTVTSASGSSVTRETLKVFSYQPGKSLLCMNTFVMAPSATNLRQRVGYFGQNNGYFLQLDGADLSFVERTLVNGSPASDTPVNRSAWLIDKLDGKGPSKKTLDITKAQILWMDFEWLGVGTVRCGFVIDGQFILCHTFDHANLISSTYITTASLPLRYEITNKNSIPSSRTLKQICSTVISEGGYELRGFQQTVEIPIGTPKALTSTGTFYPLISLRLKSTRPDAIVILSNLSFLGITNNANYNWRLIAKTATTGGTWTSTGIDSSVEYKLDATGFTGGKVVASGFTVGSNQGSTPITVTKNDLFKFQLERDSLNGTYYELLLAAASDNATANAYASVDWEEISR